MANQLTTDVPKSVYTLEDLATLSDYSLLDNLNCDPDATETGDDYEPRQVFSGHYVPVKPTPIANPVYVAHSETFFAELGFDDNLVHTEGFASLFTGDMSNVPSPMRRVGWATGYALSIYGTEYIQQCPFGTGNGYGDGRAVSVLEAVIDNYGIPKLIEDGDWDSTLPFVVLAPHLGSVPSAGYKARLDAFVEYAMRAYDIDSSRIYLTGYSQGGFLSAAYAKDFPDKIAAVAAVSPAFDDNVDPIINNFCGIERVPLWMFHATNDEVIPFSNTINVYQAIIDNCQALELPKLSLVVGAEHAIHHAVFNLEALEGGFAQAVYDSRFDTYDMSIYQWLLSHNLENR